MHASAPPSALGGGFGGPDPSRVLHGPRRDDAIYNPVIPVFRLREITLKTTLIANYNIREITLYEQDSKNQKLTQITSQNLLELNPRNKQKQEGKNKTQINRKTKNTHKFHLKLLHLNTQIKRFNNPIIRKSENIQIP